MFLLGSRNAKVIERGDAPENAGPGSCAQELVAVRNVSKRYRDFRLSIDRLSLSAGEIVGLFGLNGSGKSTFLKILLGAVTPDSGEVEIEGRALESGSWAVRSRIGYVPDVPALYESMTVAGIVDFVRGFYPDWNMELCRSLMSRFGLDPTEKVVSLSHGMRTKLLSVFALSHGAPLLLLDEPINGLDPVGRLSYCELLWEMHGQRTFQTAVISSHEVDEIAGIAHRLLFLSEGRIIFDESCERLQDEYRIACLPRPLSERMEHLPGVVARRETADQCVVLLRRGSGDAEAELAGGAGRIQPAMASPKELYLLLCQKRGGE